MKLNLKIIIVIAFQMACANALADDNLKKIARQANQAYSDGQYIFAIELYDSIINKGYVSAALYYNIGNAYFKNNQMAYAIWYYEKARKLDPGDAQINFNLNLANTRITDNIEAIPLLFYERWWRSLYSLTTADRWARLAILLAFAALALFAAYLLAQRISLKKLFFTLAVVCFVVMAFTLIFAQKQHERTHSQKAAIVFSPRVTAKSAPDAGSIDLFVIHEGTKVYIDEKIGEWYEIRLANGNVGWINKNSVRII